MSPAHNIAVPSPLLLRDYPLSTAASRAKKKSNASKRTRRLHFRVKRHFIYIHLPLPNNHTHRAEGDQIKKKKKAYEKSRSTQQLVNDNTHNKHNKKKKPQGNTSTTWRRVAEWIHPIFFPYQHRLYFLPFTPLHTRSAFPPPPGSLPNHTIPSSPPNDVRRNKKKNNKITQESFGYLLESLTFDISGRYAKQ